MPSLRYTVLASMIIGGLLWQPGVAIAACEDYPSQAEAQQALRGDPTDPQDLDPDGNGIACERFPPPYDRDPVVRPNVTPAPRVNPEPADEPEPEEPEESSGEVPVEPSEEQEAEPTPAPAPRSPLLGPAPPPLSALQGGAPLGPLPALQGGKPLAPLPAIQGGNGGAYPPGATSTGAPIIQPPNAGDGGLLR